MLVLDQKKERNKIRKFLLPKRLLVFTNQTGNGFRYEMLGCGVFTFISCSFYGSWTRSKEFIEILRCR